MPFVNCRQFMYLAISILVLRAGCGIWLYQFLIIAYLFTFQNTNDNNLQRPLKENSCQASLWRCDHIIFCQCIWIGKLKLLKLSVQRLNIWWLGRYWYLPISTIVKWSKYHRITCFWSYIWLFQMVLFFLNFILNAMISSLILYIFHSQMAIFLVLHHRGNIQSLDPLQKTPSTSPQRKNVSYLKERFWKSSCQISQMSTGK